MGASVYLPDGCRIADYRATVTAKSGAVITIKIAADDGADIGWLLEQIRKAQADLRPAPPPRPKKARPELGPVAAPLLLVHRGDDHG